MKRILFGILSVGLFCTGMAWAEHGYVDYGSSTYGYGGRYIAEPSCLAGNHRNKNDGAGALAGILIGGVLGAAIGNNIDNNDHHYRHRRGYSPHHGYRGGHHYGHRHGYHDKSSNSDDVIAGAVIGAVIGGVIGNAIENNNSTGSGHYRDADCNYWRYQDVAAPTIYPTEPKTGHRIETYPVRPGALYNSPPQQVSAGCQIVAETVSGPNGLVSYPVELCHQTDGRWYRTR